MPIGVAFRPLWRRLYAWARSMISRWVRAHVTNGASAVNDSTT